MYAKFLYFVTKAQVARFGQNTPIFGKTTRHWWLVFIINGGILHKTSRFRRERSQKDAGGRGG